MRLRECSVDGCEKPEPYVRGWCSMHYQRWRKYGDPGEPESRLTFGVETCQVDGCGREHHRRGYCSTHYSRLREHGDVCADDPILTSSERCRRRNIENAAPIGATRSHGSYVVEKISTDDSMAAMANQSVNKDWVLQHRLAMARHLGRPLTESETVHHVNGIEDDNRIENLELWESRHPRGQRYEDPHCPTCRCEDVA